MESIMWQDKEEEKEILETLENNEFMHLWYKNVPNETSVQEGNVTDGALFTSFTGEVVFVTLDH